MSPNDLKTLTDVDKGVALANIERLTNLDSSVKDSNQA
jgi:phage-related tail protein